MSEENSSIVNSARTALTSAENVGASQKRFNVILAFDLNEFDPDKLTIGYVKRVLQSRIGGPGLSITVQEAEA
jgi:hypothetical protein